MDDKPAKVRVNWKLPQLDIPLNESVGLFTTTQGAHSLLDCGYAAALLFQNLGIFDTLRVIVCLHGLSVHQREETLGKLHISIYVSLKYHEIPIEAKSRRMREEPIEHLVCESVRNHEQHRQSGGRRRNPMGSSAAEPNPPHHNAEATGNRKQDVIATNDGFE